MKKQDFLFIILVVVVFLPFFLSDAVYDWYKSFNAEHGMVMSFLKFAILSSLGEVLGLRISAGVYNRKGFGIIPRMVVWGILGMGINAAMIIFSKGVPQFMEYMGMANAAATFTSEAMSLDKVLVALAISVTMNTIFAPVFMTFHKITDTHILMCGGSIKSLITPIPMTKIITGLNWKFNGTSFLRRQSRSSGILHTPLLSCFRRICAYCLRHCWALCWEYCWQWRHGNSFFITFASC